MPAQPVMDKRLFSTIIDYHNAENPEGLAIIDETYYQSNFLTNAMMKPTNDGLRERYRRVDEITYNPRVATLDEGYRASEKQVYGGKELSFGTMRITDSLTWERKQKMLSDDNGTALKDKQMRALLDSMIKKKQYYMIYGDSSKGDGLEIDGLQKYTSKAYTIEEFQHMHDVMDDYDSTVDKLHPTRNPWDNHDKKAKLDPDMDLLCFSNQLDPDGYKDSEGNDKLQSSAVGGEAYAGVPAMTGSIKNNFCSVYGVAFGPTGVVTVFPSVVDGAGGYIMDYTENINDSYVDPRDGHTKYFKSDRYDIDSYFGIGVENRFCASRLANIYLGHGDRSKRKDEMLRLENYLIMMKDFFEKGHTGYTMQFYCSDRLITEVERFQKEYYPNGFYASNSRSFDGMNQRQRPKQIQITSDITLFSDSIFRTNEDFVPTMTYKA